MRRNQSLEPVQRLTVKHRIWLFGTSAWIVGMIDRTIAIFSNHDLTAINIIQLLLATVFFIGWLYLKPRSASEKVFDLPPLDEMNSERDLSVALDDEQEEQFTHREPANQNCSEQLVLCETASNRSPSASE
jgi:hypothetical protein